MAKIEDSITFRIPYNDSEAIDKLTEYLKNFLTKNTLILCIGTDRCIGDALGPIVGTILKSHGFKLPVEGTLEDPIHAVNLDTKLKDIKKKYPDYFIIAVDACLAYSEYVGEVQVKVGPVSPGKGVGKQLSKIGNMSIIGIVDSSDNSDLFAFTSIRLGFVMQIAKVIAFALINATK